MMGSLRTRALIVLALCAMACSALAGCAADPGTFQTIDRENGRLAPCPNTPNCVSSQDSSEEHAIDPLPFTVDAETTRMNLAAIISEMPRSRIEVNEPTYLHATFRSRIFRFVDDVEFVLDEGAGVVHVRSAARTGYSDMGVNRERMESIRQAMIE